MSKLTEVREALLAKQKQMNSIVKAASTPEGDYDFSKVLVRSFKLVLMDTTRRWLWLLGSRTIWEVLGTMPCGSHEQNFWKSIGSCTWSGTMPFVHK